MTPGPWFIGKNLILCAISAFLLILAFPPFNLWFCAWFGFVPVFFTLKNKTLKQSFFLFLITGIIYWSGIIYWLIHVTLPGTIVLILYLALYLAFFGLIIRPSTINSNTYSLIFIPSCWVILEYIRSYLLTGFPWSLLGYSQYLRPEIIQIADITGVWGVSFLLMLSNAAIVEIIYSAKHKLWLKLKKTLVILIAFLALILIYGYVKLHYSPLTTASSRLKISLIQGNIPQNLKWDINARDFIMNKYLSLSAAAAFNKPDLIIWPEAAIPAIIDEEPRFLEEIKKFNNHTNIAILTGAVRQENNNYYNCAILIDKNPGQAQEYAKLHLVPFGEYIPLKNVFPFLETVVPIGDFTSGDDYTVFSFLPPRLRLNANFAALICFEDLFPELSVNFRKNGAKFLVNITNDAWFKKTSAPFQHLQASVFRAVENRLWLVRAANTGISAFISPYGKITSLIQDKNNQSTFISGYKTANIDIAQGEMSFYTRFPYLFLFTLVILVLAWYILFVLKTKKS